MFYNDSKNTLDVYNINSASKVYFLWVALKFGRQDFKSLFVGMLLIFFLKYQKLYWHNYKNDILDYFFV
jgi:hypothetical protein